MATLSSSLALVKKRHLANPQSCFTLAVIDEKWLLAGYHKTVPLLRLLRTAPSRSAKTRRH